MTSIIGNHQLFLDNVFKQLMAHNIDLTDCWIDHLCYRVSDLDTYVQKQKELSTVGQLLTEAPVNGRPISTYKLREPLTFKSYTISLVELPSPKPNSPYPEGLEHCEFVIPYGFDEFIRKHPKAQFKTIHQHKERNPDISLSFDGFTVKFHHFSLEKIIEGEQSKA